MSLILYSVLFIFNTEFSKIYRGVTKWTEMKSCLLNFTFIHFVFATFTSVIISCHYGFSTNDARGEVCSTLSATCIVLTDSLFTVSSWTFDFFARGLFRRMFGEYAHSHVNIFLSLFKISHSLKLDKSSWTLFVTLK